MSHRKPDREELLTERRAKVVNLRKEGLSMSRIAIELGTSVDCVFRDVRAIRRFQTSTLDKSIEPEEALKRRELCSKPHNVKRRARNQYFCLSCDQSWTNKGSWKPAKQHAEEEYHNVAQGTKEQYKIKWIRQRSNPIAMEGIAA
jgi:ribosomal protein L37AE/L43A